MDYIGTKPHVANTGDAGMDLYAAQEGSVKLGQVTRFRTGTRVAIPDGHVGLIFPRSSLGAKFGVVLANSVGVIDSGYRGELIVALVSTVAARYNVSAGERIAQLVVVPFLMPSLNLVKLFDTTERGDNGFGSSGKR